MVWALFTFFIFLKFTKKLTKRWSKIGIPKKHRKSGPGGSQNGPKMAQNWSENDRKSPKWRQTHEIWGINFLMIFWIAKKLVPKKLVPKSYGPKKSYPKDLIFRPGERLPLTWRVNPSDPTQDGKRLQETPRDASRRHKTSQADATRCHETQRDATRRLETPPRRLRDALRSDFDANFHDF